MTESEGLELFEKLRKDCFEKSMNSVTLRRFFLITTRLHWGFPENHGEYEEYLKGLVYKGDNKERMKVQLFEKMDREDREEYPAIFLGFRQGLNYTKLAVGDRSEMSEDMASQTFTRKAQTSLVVSHYHASGDTALMMGESSSSYFEATRESTMHSLGLQGMEVASLIGPIRVNREAGPVFKVDLIIGLSFNTTMKVSLESHRIKKWRLRLQD